VHCIIIYILLEEGFNLAAFVLLSNNICQLSITTQYEV